MTRQPISMGSHTKSADWSTAGRQPIDFIGEHKPPACILPPIDPPTEWHLERKIEKESKKKRKSWEINEIQ